MTNPAPRTLFDKVWDSHVVTTPTNDAGHPDILYIDLQLVHEVTSPQAFEQLRSRGLQVRRPGQTMATMDHSTPTTPARADGSYDFFRSSNETQVKQLSVNCEEAGIPVFALGDERQGIVHVVAPELGLSQPGMTIVCGDSHTATHGAFGAIAFGIGTGQVANVLATQCLLVRRPTTYEVRLEGSLGPGVCAKDIILALIATIGTEGGTGSAFEFTGSTVAQLSMEQRLTICNMAIEGGARCGLFAPDDTTFSYLEGRPYAPTGRAWDDAVAAWRRLPSDQGASYDRSVQIDVSTLEPMITYGTSPGMAIGVTTPVPDPNALADASHRASSAKALDYMRFAPGKPLLGHPIDVVFVGSCTNGRITDLEDAARVLQGRHVSESVRMLVVPGSHQVKKQAEAKGLDEVFRAAGAEWREPGCSMCLAMNGDMLQPGQLSVSTSNRNFEGRQGPGGRTVLASALTAAACAVAGEITDVREML